MEPSGSRLRAEMRNASGAAWTYSSHYGLLALTGPEGGLLALFLALLLRAFSGRKGPREASPQPVPPDVVSSFERAQTVGSLPQMPTGDGDTKNAKRTFLCSDPEVAPSSSAHVARLSRRGPGHGPRGTSTGSQVARDGSYVWYRSRYGYMSELENRKRRGPPHGPSRRIAPEASRPPVEACVQTHGNAVTAPLWPVAPPPGGWVHPGTYPGVYHTGLRPRGAAWGPHEPRIRGVGVWGGLGPRWNTRLYLVAYIFYVTTSGSFGLPDRAQ